MTTKVKTGGVVPVSGQYRPTGKKTEVTFVSGKRVPPTASGSRGIPTYSGRRDIVKFLSNVPMYAIPWREYTLN